MRHRVQDKKFNRDANARKSLLTGLLRNLTEHGEITTTRVKGKEVKRLADKMMSTARGGSLESRRRLHRIFGKRDVVNTLVDRVAPAMTDRTSGFTRLETVGNRRGDNTAMVRLSWVNAPATVGSLKNADKSKWATKAEKKEAKPAKVAKPAVKQEAPAAAKSKVVAKVKVEKAPAKKATKKVVAKK